MYNRKLVLSADVYNEDNQKLFIKYIIKSCVRTRKLFLSVEKYYVENNSVTFVEEATESCAFLTNCEVYELARKLAKFQVTPISLKYIMEDELFEKKCIQEEFYGIH